ncbi:uncharacterized protein LOC143452166 [Clavelina lepadiformis]|uniref:uncharacterized protein LOC143452166 n=1 Tax=Clavelina lepadiformis TaxID=159417 RepID=UPI004042A081
MLRRRKGNFKPILPRPGCGAEKSSAKDECRPKAATKNAIPISDQPVKLKRDSAGNTEVTPERVAIENELTSSKVDKSSEDGITEDKNELVDIPMVSGWTAEKQESLQDTNSHNTSETAVHEITKGGQQQPVKSNRRRKITAMPNTKRGARVNTVQNSNKRLSVNLNKSSCEELPTKETESPAAGTSCELTDCLIPENQTVTPKVVETAATSKHEASDMILENEASTCSSAEVLNTSKSQTSPHKSPSVGLPSKVSPAFCQNSPKKATNEVKSPAAHYEALYREQQAKEKASTKRIALHKLKLLELQSCDKGKSTEWENLDRNLLSMGDLIYINPPANSGKEIGIRSKLRQMEEMTNISEESSNKDQAEQEKSKDAPVSEADPDDQIAPLVPQLRVSENGTVIIDEESLVVKSPTRRDVIHDSPVVYESGLNSVVNQCSFRRKPTARPSRWTNKQTNKFYNALRVVGADFALMSAMFRHRTRDDLRRKYHNECRKNFAKVDEALSQQHLSKWTNEMFMPDSSSDEETENKKGKQKCSLKETTKRKRQKKNNLLSSSTNNLPAYKRQRKEDNVASVSGTPETSLISGNSLDLASEVIVTNENEQPVITSISLEIPNVSPAATDVLVENVSHDILNNIIHQCEVSV